MNNNLKAETKQEKSYYYDEDRRLFKTKDGEDSELISEKYVEVLGIVRDEYGQRHSSLIRFENSDGWDREVILPWSTLIDQSSAKEAFKMLVDAGFPPGCCSKKLTEYFKTTNPSKRITILSKTGWIEKQGLQYVSPSFQICDSDRTYRLKDSSEDLGFAKHGTLQEWQNNVGEYCYGNHLLVFSLCASLSGIMLKFIPEINTTMFNFVGKSSIGKTTALRVASSVWGNKRFIQQWRATSNALEAIAESHNDNLLILDELSQSSGKDISEAFYMLGNSRGKSRMKTDSTLRKAKSWRLMILSSGEIGVADKIEESGGKVKAGQLVRAIESSLKNEYYISLAFWLSRKYPLSKISAVVSIESLFLIALNIDNSEYTIRMLKSYEVGDVEKTCDMFDELCKNRNIHNLWSLCEKFYKKNSTRKNKQKLDTFLNELSKHAVPIETIRDLLDCQYHQQPLPSKEDIPLVMISNEQIEELNIKKRPKHQWLRYLLEEISHDLIGISYSTNLVTSALISWSKSPTAKELFEKYRINSLPTEKTIRKYINEYVRKITGGTPTTRGSKEEKNAIKSQLQELFDREAPKAFEKAYGDKSAD